MKRSHDLSLQAVGLVTSVGLSAVASCAAFRAKLSNPVTTRFIGTDGEWLIAHQVPLLDGWQGLTRLAKMASMAISEALQGMPHETCIGIPLLLCVAEPQRPGRTDGLDERILTMIEAEQEWPFSDNSMVIAQGRVGAAAAMSQARALIAASKCTAVVIAGVDSLVNWRTMSHYEQQDRLLTERNANGFLPGEGAGAVMVTSPTGHVDELMCTGIGFSREDALSDGERPLRGEGMSRAITMALEEARLGLHDMDFRITDLSGERYYFKEAALAYSRTLRVRQERFDIWHPAESTGETGAASGLAILATAFMASRKKYADGRHILAHMANDGGERAALVLRRREAA